MLRAVLLLALFGAPAAAQTWADKASAPFPERLARAEASRMRVEAAARASVGPDWAVIDARRELQDAARDAERARDLLDAERGYREKALDLQDFDTIWDRRNAQDRLRLRDAQAEAAVERARRVREGRILDRLSAGDPGRLEPIP